MDNNFTLPLELPENFTIPPGMNLSNGTDGNDLLGNIFEDALNNNNGGSTSAGAEDASSSAGASSSVGGNVSRVVVEPVFEDQPMFVYQKAKSTENMADIPRLGHSDEFSYLFSFDPDGSLTDQKDYVTGLVFVGCFIFIFFLVWSIVLLIFKFCINGFLSGDPFTNPNLKDPSAQKLLNREIDEELEEEANEWRKRPIRVRLAFLLAGILQIIFAILMVTHGIANLQETTDTVEYSSNAARLLLDESVSVSQSLVQIGDTAKTLRDQIVMDLDRDNFCPQNPIFDETQAGKDILTAADASVQMLNDLGDFIEENVAGLEESLEDGKNNLDGVDDLIRSIEDYDWIGGLIAFPYLILTSLMMVGSLAAMGGVMTKCFLCFLTWTIQPLYIFVTICSYLATSLMAIFASVNADFCGGLSSTPDQVIVDILFRSGFEPDDLFYKTARYYAFQCTRRAQEDPFLFLRQYDAEIMNGRGIVQDLTSAMADVSLEQLSLGCNRDFRPLHRSLTQMIGVMDALNQASNRVFDILRCDRIVPIYKSIVYDGTCKHSIKGLTWIFSALFVISLMGMIMIMFRSSFQNTVFEAQTKEMDNESSIVVHHRTTPASKKKAEEATAERWDDEDVDDNMEQSQLLKKDRAKRR